MGPSIYVKVVGFRDVERHALNTLFRLSIGQPTSYTLWTPEAPVAPHLALIDLDAYEAVLELASPDAHPGLKMICVGEGAPDHALCTFVRPLHWPDVVKVMDSLYSADEVMDMDFGDTEAGFGAPSDARVCLLVDPSREDRMYLRARLALAGHTDVDEASTGAMALELARNRHYDLVVVGLTVSDMDGWAVIRQLVDLEPAIGRVVVSTSDKTWHMREHAEKSGCSAVLEKPYDPSKVIELLQKI